tara:strand:+ start:830 stop:1012 length:183 start_codon:yes stop_codon:yes gene_type:complete
MAKKQITVKVLKSKTDVMWYRDRIGNTFKVMKIEGKDYYEISTGKSSSKIIFKEDCKELK